jgi:hypothetical protein
LATCTTTSIGVLNDQLVVPLKVFVTPAGTLPPYACTEPKATVDAEVPLLPRVMPAPSVTNVRLTEATVVAVTATVPVADVAFADGETKPAAIATTIATDSFRPFFISCLLGNACYFRLKYLRIAVQSLGTCSSKCEHNTT